MRIQRYQPCSSLALVSSGGPFVAGGATAPAGWASFGEADAFGGGPAPVGGGAFPALEGPPPASLAATAPSGAFCTGSEALEWVPFPERVPAAHSTASSLDHLDRVA